MFNSHYSDIGQLWAALILEELYRLGVRHVCIAPGSRSSPLTLAANAHSGLSKHVHFDERGLGFFALGLCKAARQPVVVITTSGTAVANLFPAVIEAAQTDLPLVVLSADRPPELIDCGANQAIRQPGIFADYPRYHRNLPVPSQEIEATELLAWLDEGITSATSMRAGPVHLNVPLREPLYPQQQQRDFQAYLSPLQGWLNGSQPLHSGHQDHSSLKQNALSGDDVLKRGLIIAGGVNQDEADAIGKLAAHLSWPIFADIQSQLRHHPNAICFYDQLLHTPQFQEQLESCEQVLQFGGRLVSKRLQSWLEQRRWKDYIWVGATTQVLDPADLQTHRFSADISRWCEHQMTAVDAEQPQHHDWRSRLQQADRQITDWLQKQIDTSSLTELSVARHLLANPKTVRLFVGNSLPIRLLDMFGAPKHATSIFSNRGASGIDGLLATAIGCQQAKPNQPLTLLIGDMSLMHDLNSLLMLTSLVCPVVVVVLNNDGGNIFRLLPVPEQHGVRERYYQLPHNHDFESICRSMQIRSATPSTMLEFEAAYSQALAFPGATLLQVCVSADEAPQMIQQLAEKLRALSF